MVGGGADALQSSPCFDETQLSTKHSTILLVGVEFTLGAKHKVIRMRDLNILNQSKSLTLVYLVPFVVRGGMFLSVDGNTSVDKFIVYDVVHLHVVQNDGPLSAVAGKPFSTLGDQAGAMAPQKSFPPILSKSAVLKLYSF